MTTPIPPMPTLRQDRHGDYSWSSILELQSYAKQGWSEVRDLRAKLDEQIQTTARIASERACLQVDIRELQSKLEAAESESAIWQALELSAIKTCGETNLALEHANNQAAKLAEALEIAKAAMDERRSYADALEWKYGSEWTEEDAKVAGTLREYREGQ